MKAVVLVGGEGTRLRPLTYTIPKQMLPVAGTTMLERVVAQLATHGVTDAILSMGYRPDAFTRAFPDGRASGVHLTYAVEPEPLDTAGAVRFAAAAAGIDEPFIVVNGDVLTDVDIGALVGFHRDRGAEGTIHLTRVDDPSAFGVVPTDASGRVTAFVEKPRRDQAPTDLINAGTYVLEPSVLDRIASDRRVSIEREVFPAMVGEGSLFALASPAYWIDAGTPDKYLQAQLDLLDGTRSTGPSGRGPADGASLLARGFWAQGPVTVEGEVRPPALLGAGAAVASGAVVERSVLGPDARVLPHARVTRSALLWGATVCTGAVVEDSILGEDAVVGDHACVAGLSVVGGRARVAPGQQLEAARIRA